MNNFRKNIFPFILLLILSGFLPAMTSHLFADLLKKTDSSIHVGNLSNLNKNTGVQPDTSNAIKNLHVEVDKYGDTIIAKVGTHNILLNEFVNRYTDYLFATGTKDNYATRKSILTNIMNEILLSQYDNNQKILSDKNYKDELAWSKNQAILGFLKDREVYAKISVTDDELRTAFERVNEQISARHLYAPTEEQANYLYDQIRKGVSFDSLAKQVFTDSTLKNNGGYLGYFTWGDMDPDFEDVAYSLKPGEVSKPVKTVYGYSIIKLEDRKPNPLLTENEYLNKKHKLERTLKIKKKGPSERTYISSIFDPSKVNFNETALGNILSELLHSKLKQVEIKDKRKSSLNCVEYEGKKYSSSEISKKINSIPLFHRDKITAVNNLKDAIKGLILQDKLIKIAHSKGYDKDPLVSMMYDKLANVVFLRYKFDEIIHKVELPDSTVKGFYLKNIGQFTSPDELNLQEILVPRWTLADSLKLMLDQGSDFGNLAEKYSVRKWSAKNKGQMGFAPVSKYGMFRDKFWNSQVGEVLGPMKIENLYGIFKVLGKKQGQAIDFNMIKEQATAFCKKEMQAGIMNDYLNRLNKKVKSTVYEDVLSNIKLDSAYSN
jgi:parvulin-like peptidyl-prolyl isomerase